MFSPAFTGSGESEFVIDRSAEETVVVAVAESLEPFGSVVAEITVAVLEMLAPPVPFTVATIVIVADAPTASDEKPTVRLLSLPPHNPLAVELQDTNVRLDGKLSVTKTFCAVPIPLFVTVMVYVISDPTVTGSGESELVIDRSAVVVSRHPDE